MEMKAEDRVLIKNLAHTIEIINTINGGMVEPRVRIFKEESGWRVKVLVPGVDVDNIKLEVKNNQLLIFQLITEPNTSNIELPYLISALNLSPKVDQESIFAELDHKEIIILLPINEEASGYEREIDINKR